NSLLLRDLDPGKPVYADYQLTVAVSRTVQGEISLTNAAPYPLSLDGASITLPNYLRPVAANGVFGEPVVGETTTTWPFAPGAAIPALQQLAIGITDVTGARIPSVAGELTVTLNGETTHFSLAALVTEPSRYNLLWDAYSEFAKTYGAKGLPILNCTTPNGVKRTNCIGGKATTPGFVNWLDAEDLLAAGSGSDGNTQFTYTVRVDPIALAEGKARNVAHLINPPDDDDAEVIITYRKKQTDPPGSDSNPPGGGGSGSGDTGGGGSGSGGTGSGGTSTGGTGTGSESGGSTGSGSGVVSTVAAASSAVVGAMTRTGVSLTGAAIALVTVSTGLVLSLRRRRSNSGA
ncbi:MAG: hypothetical protein FWG25_03275, partial [Promicromonosporaceae bacterium]|nr:hypothetical protein [Promicromonosporaceae bacterium]